MCWWSRAGVLERLRHQRFFSGKELNRALRALSERSYEYVGGRASRHRLVRRGWCHYYLVPCQHIWAQVVVRVTRRTVEVFQRDQRLDGHARCAFQPPHTMVAAHLPPVRREVASWST